MDPESSTTLYEFVLSLHSIVRWGVVLFGALVLLQSLLGVLAAGELGKLGKRLGLAFMIFLDIQVLVGIALHVFLSPTTKASMEDFGGSMGDPDQRFWLVEHGGAMLIALVCVHLGRMIARRAKSERSAHLRRFLTTAIALLLIGGFTPWPIFEGARSRPWVRLPF